MAVSRQYHGQGIGRMLHDAASKLAQENNAMTMTVETLSPYESDENYLKTYHFYLSNGFSPLINVKPQGYQWNMVYMVKSLEMTGAIWDGSSLQNNKRGYTLWAVELKETHEMIGFIGLNDTSWQSHFTPAVEIGWRLGSQYWGQGYATEGAIACLEYGFNTMNLNEIVSFTVPDNVKSIQVMERIGLKRDIKGDFAHPRLAADHPLSQHVLYRLTRNDYLQGGKQNWQMENCDIVLTLTFPDFAVCPPR